MAAVITATLDTPNQRIGVKLTGWTSPATGAITVSRVHPDTSRWPVRGLTATSGGAAFAWDYEAPFGLPVSYVAMNGSSEVFSSSATLPITDSWLSAPGLPSYAVLVTPTGKPAIGQQRPAATLQPWGRSTPVVLTDSRKAATFPLSLRTFTQGQADDLDALLDASPTLLLRIPGTRQAWQYVTVSATTATAAVHFQATTAGDVGDWYDWSLTCVVTDSPIGGVYGDPSASYQAIKDTYATYTALRSGKASYLAVLQGV